MTSETAWKYAMAYASLLVAQPALAESGTYESVVSLVHAYTSMEYNGDTISGGSSRGTSTVVSSSGAPFVAGKSSAFQCVIFAKKSAAGMDLEAPCTTTDSSGDKMYSLAKRKAGDVTEGTNAPGTSLIIGGTGKYAGISGSCTYNVAYLPENRLVSTTKCRWQK